MQHGLLLSFMTKPFAGLSGSSSHLHLSLFEGGPQHLLGRRRERADAGVPLGDRRAPGACAWSERPARTDRQLREAVPKRNLCPCEHHLGLREPFRRGARQGRARGPHAHREPPGVGSLESLPRARGDALCRARRHPAAIQPPEPMATSAYQLDDLDLLPATLEESLDAFESDETLRDAFHPEFVKAFLALKRHEVKKAREAVVRLRGWADRRGDGLGARPVPVPVVSRGEVTRARSAGHRDILCPGAGASAA